MFRRGAIFILLMAQGLSLTATAAPSVYTRERGQDEGTAFSLLSVVVPGFSQWKQGQTGWGIGYSGSAVAGLGYALASLNGPEDRYLEIDRDVSLGLQIYQTSGSLSAFHGMRTTIFSRKEHSEWDFLPEDETPLDLMLSPFRFDYLTRPTTLIPMGIFAALFFFVLPHAEDERVNFDNVRFGDAAFLGATSYMAGTGEEALFRGVLMPHFQKWWGNPWLANLATAGIFAAAHIDPDRRRFFVPWPQFIGGYYLGWVTQFRGYRISESIFIHTWYDVMVFLAGYASEKKVVYLPLPTIQMRF